MGVMANGEFGRRMQEALGLEGRKVRSMQLNAVNGAYVSVVVDMLVSGDQSERALSVIEAIDWKPMVITYQTTLQDQWERTALPNEGSGDHAESDTTEDDTEVEAPDEPATEG